MQGCLKLIPDNIERVVMAFSGGLDSSVLLHLLVSHVRAFNILPWHVNHGLQESANEMESFCLAVASDYGLEMKTSRLGLDPHRGNQESEARQARYALFEQALMPVDCLLTAHHADDQIETFILNALRGSSSAGLRGIARSRPIGQSILLRPLLDVSRDEISAYASRHRLQWCEDPSNALDRYDRNYLRRQVIPSLKSRWPGCLGSIRSVVEIQAETEAVLEDLAAQDYQVTRKPSNHETSDHLSIPGMLELTKPRRKNLIRHWLKVHGCASLPQGRLNELLNQMKSRQSSRSMVRGKEYSVRIYDRSLFIVPDEALPRLQEVYEFDRSSVLKIEEIDLEIERKEIISYLDEKDTGQSITLMFRVRSNSPNPAQHRLKRLFQKHRIPPWKRSVTPQIYLDDELLGLWI